MSTYKEQEEKSCSMEMVVVTRDGGSCVSGRSGSVGFGNWPQYLKNTRLFLKFLLTFWA